MSREFETVNTDHPHRQIWAIAGPAILANSSAPLVGLVDTWAIGHLPGAVHLAAVGLGSVIFNYILWAFGFLRMGTTGMIAQAKGRDDAADQMVTEVRSCVLALFFGVLLLLFQEAILVLSLKAMAPPDKVAAITAQYFHIRIWAAPFTLLGYAITGVLFGLARVRTILWLQLFLNITNATLNVTFVVGLGMGVPGEQGPLDQLLRGVHRRNGAAVPGGSLLDGGRPTVEGPLAHAHGRVRDERDRGVRALGLHDEGAGPHPHRGG